MTACDASGRRPRPYVPAPLVDYSEKHKVGILTVGSCHDAVVEARHRLSENGIGVNYLRVKAFPFTDRVQGFLDQHDRVYVVEQNRDAQLKGSAAAGDASRAEQAEFAALL